MSSVSKFIHLIACEIEGSWYNMEGCRGKKVVNDIGNPVHDGSVKAPKNHKSRFINLHKENVSKGRVNPGHSLPQLLLKGEVVSQPMSSLASLSKYMMDYWPDVTNNSCGLHFHASFNNNGYYSCLMQESFYAFCKKSLEAFYLEEKLNKIFKERFYNETEWARKYCADKFHPEKQVYVNKKVYHDHCPDRYTILNYCYGLHKTLEIRVFSAHMSPKTAVRCAHWWVDCLNKYLETHYSDFAKTAIESDVNFEIDIPEKKEHSLIIPDDVADLVKKGILTFGEPEETIKISDNQDDFTELLKKELSFK